MSNNETNQGGSAVNQAASSKALAPIPTNRAVPLGYHSNIMLFRGPALGRGSGRGAGEGRGRGAPTNHDRKISRSTLPSTSTRSFPQSREEVSGAGSANKAPHTTGDSGVSGAVAAPSRSQSGGKPDTATGGIKREVSSSSSDSEEVQPRVPNHRRRSILHIRGGGGCGLHNFVGRGNGYVAVNINRNDRGRDQNPTAHRGPRNGHREDRSLSGHGHRGKLVGRKRSRTSGDRSNDRDKASRHRRTSADDGGRRGRRRVSYSRSSSRRYRRSSVSVLRGRKYNYSQSEESTREQRAISRQRSRTPVRGDEADNAASARNMSPVPIRHLNDADEAQADARTTQKEYSDSFSPEPRSPSSRHRAKSAHRGYSDESECEMRYPRFDGRLPRRRGAIPFLSLIRNEGCRHGAGVEVGTRQRLIPLLPPSSRRKPLVVPAPPNGDLPSLPIIPPATQLVAFNEYIVHKVIGKGVGSIVVQVSKLEEECPEVGAVVEDSGAAQQKVEKRSNDTAAAALQSEAGSSAAVASSTKHRSGSLKVTSSGVQQRFSLSTGLPMMLGMKIFRGWSTYDKAADEEAEAISTVLRTTHCKYLMPALERIEHPSHCALVFPLCGPSILEVLEGNRTNGLSKGLPHTVVKSILFQLISCVRDLHAAGLVHTDIKPENTLFRSTDMMTMTFELPPSTGKSYIKKQVPDPSGTLGSNGEPKMITVKEKLKEPLSTPPVPTVRTVRLPVSSSIYVIDLGNAVYIRDLTLKDEVMGTREGVSKTFIQTRHYRAPEVLFDAGWDKSSDLWSVGCMITELLTGDCLFPMHNDVEHIALIEKAVGAIPASLYGRTKVSKEFCSLYQQAGASPQPENAPAPVSPTGHSSQAAAASGGALHQPASAGGTLSPSTFLKLRSSYVKQLSKGSLKMIERQRTVRRVIEKHVFGEEGKRLADLAEGLLQYDPTRRLTAQEACIHPYFTQMW